MNDSDRLDPKRAAMEALADYDKEETERRAAETAREAGKEKAKRLKRVVQWTVIVVCLGIIGYQMPRVVSVLDPEEKPLRRGAMTTDALTDRCIAALWKVSKRLQEGKSPGTDLVCPASKMPFEIKALRDDVVVRSPRPELYGFREIRVSKKKPVPELIR